MTALLPTKKITKVSGISSKTLKTYLKKGWVSEPKFKSHGRAGGASLYWPRDILIQISHIKALKASGRSLAQIDLILKGENQC